MELNHTTPGACTQKTTAEILIRLCSFPLSSSWLGNEICLDAHQVITREWNVAHICKGTLFRCEEKINHRIHRKIDGSGKYTKWSSPGPKRKHHMLSHRWSLASDFQICVNLQCQWRSGNQKDPRRQKERSFEVGMREQNAGVEKGVSGDESKRWGRVHQNYRCMKSQWKTHQSVS